MPSETLGCSAPLTAGWRGGIHQPFQIAGRRTVTADHPRERRGPAHGQVVKVWYLAGKSDRGGGEADASDLSGNDAPAISNKRAA